MKDSLQEFAHLQVEMLLRKVDAQVRRAAESADAGAVHDLRVAVRRLRRALNSLKQFFTGKSWKRTGKRLSKLFDVAGAVRDNDIALDLLREAGIAKGARIMLALQSRRRKAEMRLRVQLQAWLEREL